MQPRDVWFERLAPESTVARAYPGVRDDGYYARTWLQYGYRWARTAADRAGELLAGQAAILAAVTGRDQSEAIRAALAEHRAELLGELRGELAELLEQRAELGADAVLDALAERLAGRPELGDA